MGRPTAAADPTETAQGAPGLRASPAAPEAASEAGVVGVTGATSTPESSPAPAFSLADLAGLIQDMGASLKDDLRAELDQLRAENRDLADRLAEAERTGGPRFQPTDPTSNPQSYQQAMAMVMPGGDPVMGARNLPVGTDSHELPDSILNEFRQELEPGDRVRLRRDVRRKDHPLSWGEVADAVGRVDCPVVKRKVPCAGSFRPGEPCRVCGFAPTVKKVYWFDRRAAAWCYQVRIPGLTTVNGMLFFGNELELLA